PSMGCVRYLMWGGPQSAPARFLGGRGTRGHAGRHEPRTVFAATRSMTTRASLGHSSVPAAASEPGRDPCPGSLQAAGALHSTLDDHRFGYERVNAPG